MFGLDVAIVLAWSGWIFYRIDHRGSWGLWTTSQNKWYTATRQRTGGYGWPIQVYGTYYLLMNPALSLAAWGYTRTFDDEEAFYIATQVLFFLAVAMDKIWHVLHWDRRDPRAAMWVVWLVVCPLYIAASVTCALTPVAAWQKWTLFSLLIVQAIWFLQNGYIDYQWQRFSQLGMNRYEARNHPNIK